MGYIHKGDKINKLLNLGGSEAKYSDNGKWYHHLIAFPGLLIDRNGFLIFRNEDEYSDFRKTKDLNISQGISRLKGYKHFSQEQDELLVANKLKSNDGDIISCLDELYHNLETVENYLTDSNLENREKIAKYIKRGTCFVSYKVGTEYRFAPSKFIGYKNNSLNNHIPSATDGRDTNRAINEILDLTPVADTFLEEKYVAYCFNLGFPANKTGGYGAVRKFWNITLQEDFKENVIETCEFPEGRIVERIHKARERNNKVIQIAKENFKRKNGKLFCQVCGFDFEHKYGALGLNFVEAHHTIAVCDMPINHVTKPEEIAMLCPNCHRMVHKKRPWLTINELKTILDK